MIFSPADLFICAIGNETGQSIVGASVRGDYESLAWPRRLSTDALQSLRR